LRGSRSRNGAALDAATQVEDKLARQDATKAVETEVLEAYASPDDPEYSELLGKVQNIFDKLEKQIIRERIAIHKKRPGRPREKEIRKITIERACCRARTARRSSRAARRRAISVAALGTLKEEMRLDTLVARDQEVTTGTTTTSRPSAWASGLHARPKRA